MNKSQRHFLLALCVGCFLFSLVVITASSMAVDPLLQVEGDLLVRQRGFWPTAPM